jgi:phosphoserine aminotransferase
MVSFYPGPSKLHPEIPRFFQQACNSGLLSMNHRSEPFMHLYQQTQDLLKKQLGIPSEYAIFFASSATECWEIINQAYLPLLSLHLYSGAFGEKWYQYRAKLGPGAMPFVLHPDKSLPVNTLRKLSVCHPGVVCVTQNETSNASQIRNKSLKKIKRIFPDAVLCIDATSSMGGVAHHWGYADIWYASVQKCFGLPAGMAVMVCSPKALERAKSLGLGQYYNSLVYLSAMQQKYQTTHTPNVLGIYLLNKVMEMAEPIEKVEQKLEDRMASFNQALQEAGHSLLIHHKRFRSTTLTALKGEEKWIAATKKQALEAGFLLGNGYGEWKTQTFRVANFPAHTDEEFERLTAFLTTLPPSVEFPA